MAYTFFPQEIPNMMNFFFASYYFYFTMSSSKGNL